MSLYDYEKSKEIAAQDYPFYALIMAAIRQADTDNALMLKMAFPVTFEEFAARYRSPGGLLEIEQQGPIPLANCDECTYNWKYIRGLETNGHCYMFNTLPGKQCAQFKSRS